MRNLLTFSIPFSTPKITTRAVAARNTRNHTTGSPVELIKFTKKELSAAAFAPPKLKDARYFVTHPPITQ